MTKVVVSSHNLSSPSAQNCFKKPTNEPITRHSLFETLETGKIIVTNKDEIDTVLHNMHAEKKRRLDLGSSHFRILRDTESWV
jgi:hypothetical protein